MISELYATSLVILRGMERTLVEEDIAYITGTAFKVCVNVLWPAVLATTTNFRALLHLSDRARLVRSSYLPFCHKKSIAMEKNSRKSLL